MDESKVKVLKEQEWRKIDGFMHHWKYGVPENGALRDEKKYIHRSLVPYEELPQEDRDRERIRIEFLETTGW